MYPSYNVATVLALPAITFFALLNEGYRLKYEYAILLSQISDLPSMERGDRDKFYDNLKWASTHPSDILKQDGEGADPNQIKKLLG